MRCILATLLMLCCPLLVADSPERSVTILAEGFIEAIPDTVKFSTTVKQTRPNLDDARAAVAEALKSWALEGR